SDDSCELGLPVRYRNRELGTLGCRGVSVAGWYYVAVAVGPRAAGSDVDVPVTLEVSLSGTPQDGPQYQYASAREKERGTFGEGVAKASYSSQPEDEPVRRNGKVRWIESLGFFGTAVLVVLGGVVVVFAILHRMSRRRNR